MKQREKIFTKRNSKEKLKYRGYYSQPTVSQNKIVFVCENNLWQVSLRGGPAQRLTSTLSEINSPSFSNNGLWIACCTSEEGGHDVYLMESNGGPLKRLTWLNTVTNIVGWSYNDKGIFFRSTHEAIHSRGCDAWLYMINIDGGPLERLPYGPAMTLCQKTKGKKATVIGRNALNNSRWKRYRGGMTGEIWVDKKNEGNFKRLFAGFPTNPVRPFWMRERIWFVSDHQGIGNLYSCNVDGNDLIQETFQTEYYVRFPSTNGETVVYQVGGELWKINQNEDNSPLRENPIEIDWFSNKIGLQRRFFYGDKFWEKSTIHPQGHEIALTARGRLFSMPLWEEAVRQHGIRDGVRYRLPCWLSNGNIAVISDSSVSENKKKKLKSIEEQLDIFEPIPSEKPILSQKLPPGRIQEITSSPRNQHLAISSSRMEIFLIIVNKEKIFNLDNSNIREIRDLTFSPDGKWLAYTKYISLELTAIFIIDLNPSKNGDFIKPSSPIQITEPIRYDFSPSFDPEGRWLYFISSRTFNPIWDTIQTGTSFSRSMKPYLITLKKSTQNPFIPKPQPPGKTRDGNTNKGTQEAFGDTKKSKHSNSQLEIDLDGISNRIVEFPVSEGVFSQIVGLSNKVLYSEFPISGTLDDLNNEDEEESDDGILWLYDFDKQEIEKITDEIGSIEVSSLEESENECRVILYNSGKKMRALEAGITVGEENKIEKDFSRKSGWIDLSRIRISVQYQMEWTQMFNEAWRLQKEFFWTEDLSGVDWEKVYQRYSRLLPNIGSRSELSDLIWEMQGELGTSHAYEYGGDYPSRTNYPVGCLGVDLEYDKKLEEWIFKKIYKGDIWKANSHSPLAQPGIKIEEGDSLLAIGGIKVDKNRTPGELLVNQAGHFVSLTVSKQTNKKSKKSHQILVKTLFGEHEVRYREWVSNNLKKVNKLTSGRIGYIHIPDMNTNGISEFHRGFLTQVDREGLIVDVRYNAGGMVSPLILEKLTHQHLGYDVPRWGSPESYPYHTLRGHLVLIANQFTGSDGDMLTESFRELKLGPIVGKRTWGGVIGIDGRYQLVDGTTTTQPQYSILFHNSGWSVENHGVSPDFEVEDTPKSYIKEEDPLLQKAIHEILKLLKEKPVKPLICPPSPKKTLPN